jgi:hypothetical protein
MTSSKKEQFMQSVKDNKQLRTEMQEVLKHEVAQRHSYFQLKYFLIGKEPTLQSKMWQCIRELKTRQESMDSLELEVDETKDKLELLDISIGKLRLDQEQASVLPPWNTENYNGLDIPDGAKYGELFQREIDIKIRQIERQKKAAEANLLQLADRKKWLEEECRFFLETFKNLQKIEPLKHFDDIASQKEYWGERLAQKLNLKMLTHNQLDTELVETIVALPEDMPIRKQAMGTLNLRHANMVHQLKETMSRIEGKKEEPNKEK